ncbi:unnamed protein product [Mortierella alpina]
MSEPTQKEISIHVPAKQPSPSPSLRRPKVLSPRAMASYWGQAQGHFCARYRAKVPNLGFRVSVCTRVLEHLFHPSTGVHPLKGCFLGGHSMGTRVAGTVAAQLAGGSSTKAAPVKKAAAAKGKTKKPAASKPAETESSSSSESLPASFVPGLVLFSYPLHTPDNTKALRDQILLDIPASISTLFVSGLKDTMCQPPLFAKVFKDMKSSPREVIQVTDADHGLGFGSSKPAQGKKEALIAGISEWTTAFMDEAIAALESEDKQKTPNAAAASTKKKADLKKVADEWTVAVSTVAL